MRWVAAVAALLVATAASPAPIDRHALVSRHDIELTAIDRHAPLMVGNGNLAFTADLTGLQTFPERYSPLAPLLTMAQWAWHSFPNPHGWSEDDGLVEVPIPGGGTEPYPWIRDWSELDRNPALVWLRENPHRFSLLRLSLTLDGEPLRFERVSDTHQRLDLWTGTLHSTFRVDGTPVAVETMVHPDRDIVVVDISSRLARHGQLGVDVRYPGVAAQLNPDPSDFAHDESHTTRITSRRSGGLRVERQLDDTPFESAIVAPGATIEQRGPHGFRVVATSSDHLRLGVSFDRHTADWPAVSDAPQRTARAWQDYWRRGGAIDFSGSTDPRAAELERRVVLSQYLARINAAGEIPPQEEGLFSNSWNGKFHLEVQPLHLAHFAAWGRPELLERNLGWYLDALPLAQATAKRHGVEGAWWTKMAGPEGRNSPSTINPFIMWQQPAPIYLAEMVWRARGDRATLDRYAELVEQTAKLLASWPRRHASGTLMLGPPIIPVQENHPPLTTINPAFEAEFFRYGLVVAQQWRERRGLSRNAEWDAVIADLVPPAIADGLVLPAASEPDFWRQTVATCSGDATRDGCLNRDHPSMLMAYGLIAGRVDPEAMRRTLRSVEQHWDLRQTWGWDFPVIAMTAARLGEREAAVDWLFRDLPNNQWGVSGMTPRVHLETETRLVGPAAANASAGPDSPGFRRAAETYFPSNGSLLLAVAMMAEGWDGSHGAAPGFPERGWVVRTEGLSPVP